MQTMEMNLIKNIKYNIPQMKKVIQFFKMISDLWYPVQIMD